MKSRNTTAANDLKQSKTTILKKTVLQNYSNKLRQSKLEVNNASQSLILPNQSG